MRIAFIGGGNMGEAMLSKILDSGLATQSEISVGNHADERRKYLVQKYDIEVTGNNLVSAGKGDIVVLSVKPQQVPEVFDEIGGRLKETQLVLSIMAGVTLHTLVGGLRHNRIVRVMPNTPAQIGEGMSVWTATRGVSELQKSQARSILQSIGKEIYVEDEKYLDMATAIHGSGPAYFFLFVESLVEAGMKLGFTRDVAQQLVVQTMIGSGHLIEKSGKSPAELRVMVTSPGGTTAEALKVFEKGELARLVSEAVTAAYKRAVELGGGSK